jgi:hypothetical protein
MLREKKHLCDPIRLPVPYSSDSIMYLVSSRSIAGFVCAYIGRTKETNDYSDPLFPKETVSNST